MPENISYTPEEVAKILKISKYTVYELIKRGELTAYRIGRKVRVEATDLEIYKQKAKGLDPTLPKPNCRLEENLVPADEGLIICGQDIILDILTRHLEKHNPNVPYLRQFIGSINGLFALYKGSANAVTAHLWDSDSDDYNIPYVRRLLPGYRAVIINLVYRMEGFYVAKENPKNIRDWADLTKPGILFVNREKGSGARVLLDEKLRIFNIDHSLVNGYDKEELSHLAVASCVARGEADVGLGIEKAAIQVQNVDFIPLQKERYDLVILKEDLDKPQFKSLFSVLQSNAFHKEVAGIGGYDVSKMGEIIAEI